MSDTDIAAIFRDGFALDEEERRPPPSSPRPRREKRVPVASVPSKPRVHITCQFRDAAAMVYDLSVGEHKIELRVQPSSAAHAGWNVALIVKGDARVLDATAATRPLALTALAELSGDAFSGDEWDQIRGALTDVRAL